MATLPNPYDQFESNPYDSFDAPKAEPQKSGVGDWIKALTQYTPPVLGYKLNEKLDNLTNKIAYDVGGAVTDIHSKLPVTRGIAPELGLVANAVTKALPSIGVGELAKAAAPALDWAAKGLIQSSIKPSSQDLLTGKAPRAIQTLLDEGISPTTGGMNELRGMATSQNQKVADLISKTGGTVDKSAAASRIQDVVSKAETLHPIPNEVLPTIEKVYTGFMKNKLIPENIPVEQAQAVKQEIYRMMKYGELKADLPKEAAYKALARGLKEELEKSVPGVDALNKRAGDLWNALNVSERRALMDLNRNPINFGVFSHSPTMFATYLADKSATFKGMLAKILYSGKEQIPATTARLGAATYEATRPQTDTLSLSEMLGNQ